MVTRQAGRVHNGHIELLEPIAIPEGSEVLVAIEVVSSTPARGAAVEGTLSTTRTALDEFSQTSRPIEDLLNKGAAIDRASAGKAIDAMCERLGIERVEPIGAEALQALTIEEGIRPGDNSFSRAIIEMREE